MESILENFLKYVFWLSATHSEEQKNIWVISAELGKIKDTKFPSYFVCKNNQTDVWKCDFQRVGTIKLFKNWLTFSTQPCGKAKTPGQEVPDYVPGEI